MSTFDPETATPPAPDDAPQNSLLLPSLEIKNFRAFRHLTIPKLGRVNLITGKNNVGKSSVLEAIRLYAQRIPFRLLRSILLSRNEIRPFNSSHDDTRKTEQQLSIGIESSVDAGDVAGIRSLFHGRPALERLERYTNDISIGPYKADDDVLLKIYLNWADPFMREASRIKGPYSTRDSHHANKQNMILNVLDEIPLQIIALFDNYIGQIEVEVLKKGGSEFTPRAIAPLSDCIYIPADGINVYESGVLWDRISLTEREQDVIHALKLITHDLERINFIGDKDGSAYTGRVPVVKLGRFNAPVSLKSLGDGAYRLFTLALVLSNAEDGILLVDEIENGIHYSALPDVWRLIFQTARRLNVQVFATTHSWDCIEAFQKAASEDDDPNSGVLVRLQNDDSGDVTATVFDERRLAFATRDGIEVR